MDYSADWIDRVENRIKQTGLDTVNLDVAVSSINRAAEEVMSFCNRDDIPDKAANTFVDLCVAQYIYFMCATSQIDENFFMKGLRSLTMGDVSYTYSVPEEEYPIGIDGMIELYWKRSLNVFRRFRRLPRAWV